jgi:DNA-binding transcriptional ArsR family regulator
MSIDLKETNGWELFKALGEPNRFQLLLKLCGCTQPVSVGELADQVPQDQSVVSRHLKQMQTAGALTSEKQGRQTLYQVNALALAGALRSLAAMLENCECCKSGGCCAPGEGE